MLSLPTLLSRFRRATWPLAQTGLLLTAMLGTTPAVAAPGVPGLRHYAPRQVKVRPFITDDARVVGERLAQLETWARVDHAALQQWAIVAYGPTKWLELSLGGVFGADREPDGNRLAYALPLLAAKVLLREYKAGAGPGFGVAAGTFLPYGKGTFKAVGYGTFGYVTVSQCFGEGERLLLHLNGGGNYLRVGNPEAGTDPHQLVATWGFGGQLRTVGGLHVVGELFSGDPYVPGTGTAYQTGFRYFVSPLVQVDATVGQGLAGRVQLPFWASAGVRIVTTRFQKPDPLPR